MSEWSTVFLGVIALSSLTMALLQVGALIAGLRAVRAAERTAARVEESLQPLVKRVDNIGAEVSQVVGHAKHGLERVDAALAEWEARAGRTADMVRSSVQVPAREASAVVAGVRAAVSRIGSRTRAARARGSVTDEQSVPRVR